MSTVVRAYAAQEAGGKFEKFEYSLPDIGPDDVDISVESCGICHSDLSMWKNEWELTNYPFVGGHEVVGKVSAAGEHVAGLKVGDRVGLGWFCQSCMHCDQCMSGDHNLCPDVHGTITHQHGGFADKVRCHWGWAAKLPEALDPTKAGPLLCGGVTVFNPLVQLDVRPTDRVAIVGVGGLGHLAIQFAKAWGCHVTALSRGRSKEATARELGAHDFVATGEDNSLDSVKGKFDVIVNTTDAELPWGSYVDALSQRGRLHTVGAAPKIESSVFPLIQGQKSLSASPLGSIATTRQMLEFASRHHVEAVTEVHDMADINEAFDELENGSPRFRLVLKR
jgi:uncharacterized zinc-type alcohol dehydrogenase-like protein